MASAKGKGGKPAFWTAGHRATSHVQFLQMTHSYVSAHFQLTVPERTMALSMQSVFKQYTTMESSVGSNSGEEWFDLEHVS